MHVKDARKQSFYPSNLLIQGRSRKHAQLNILGLIEEDVTGHGSLVFMVQKADWGLV